MLALIGTASCHGFFSVSELCPRMVWSIQLQKWFTVSRLVVPGEFLPYDSPAAEAHVENFRRTVRDLAPCRPSKSNATSGYVPADLKSCEHVFIREDAHKPPLANPYRGPYLVLARTNKSFCVQLDNREDWLSIDRLKPASIDVSNHNRDTVTRSGRTS